MTDSDPASGEPAFSTPTSPDVLRRSISLPMLILYGVGTMVGGGFYALLGRVAGEAGMAAPFALVLTGVLAVLCALSFAELVSRYPVSAGEVRYVSIGFGRRELSTFTGGLVILTGTVSAATLSLATIKFLQDLVDVNEALGIAVLVVMLGAVAAWGVGKSVGLVAIITVIEVGALIVVAVLAGDSLGDLPERKGELLPAWDWSVWSGVFAGAFLAFYAFIGFEDMVNMAEEAERPRIHVPLAIIAAIVITGGLYLLVSTIAVLAVPPPDLAASNTPLAEVVGETGWFADTGLVYVSILTGVNGALVQIVMATRVAYGMAASGLAPPRLGVVRGTTQTPVFATVVMTALVMTLALFFPLTTLARATSTIILIVFLLVNLALLRIKGSAIPAPEGTAFQVPRYVPLMGALACAAVLGYRMWELAAG